MSKTYISVPPPSPEPKVYIALLTQTGEDAPVATVLENTLGGTAVWARTNAGQYDLTLVGAFTGTATPIDYAGKGAGDALNAVSGYKSSSDVYALRTYAAADLTSSADDVLVDFLFEITVYP